MEQRQLSDPFGFLVDAELAGAELSRFDSDGLLCRAPGRRPDRSIGHSRGAALTTSAG